MRTRTLVLASVLVLLFTAGVVAVAGCGEDETATPPPTAAATGTGGDAGGDTGGGETDGATLYADNCARCHGDDGDGGVGPDLRGLADEGAVAAKVRGGGGGMPAFADTLDATQIDALSAHVVALQ